MTKKGKGKGKKTSLMGIPFSRSPKHDTAKMLPSQDIDGLADYIKTRSPKNVVLCVGAGISTNSGIPDFRTPGTGLYSNLQALKLPYPEAVFSLQYFRQDPEPFYTLAQSLYPGSYKPTLTHSFMRLLQDRGMLLRVFTQNIDTLERIAGVEGDNIVEAHGSFAASRCIDCSKEFSNEKMKEVIDAKEIPKCVSCGGLVKPDIVFFGEALPMRFFERRVDMHRTDLVLIIGTSLVVHPFAELPNYTPPSVPRIVINYHPLDDFERPNDVYIPGDCDASIWSLCEKLGWTEALQKLHNEVGGVDHKFGEKEGEGVDTQDVVDKLARELAEELRLDKEEDGEIRRVKEGALLKDSWDDDTVVVTKKDAEASKDAEVSKNAEPAKATQPVKGDADGESNAEKSKDEGKAEDGEKPATDPKL